MSDLKITLTFIGGGDCGEILKEFQVKTKGKISYDGMKTQQETADYLNNADVLLSIGNKESPMAPSKIYEYMGMGKPIIHIYSDANDPCIEPLLAYGNCLLLDEGNIDYKEVVNFIKNRKNIDAEDIKKRFITSTPAYTAKIIENC